MRTIWPFRRHLQGFDRRESRESAKPLSHVDDRGPAKYFHGRRQILRDFANHCQRAAARHSGSTFLIHGAPGVGKTALLTECAKRASASGWQTIEVFQNAFWDPYALRNALWPHRTRRITTAFRQIGAPGVISAELDTEMRGRAAIDMLKLGKEKLLLILDEVQHLGEFGAQSIERATIASIVLGSIHNGKIGRPVMLLAGGLGTSKKAFDSLGVSRFSGGCVVELGPLSTQAEQNVLHDWLTKDGQARGDTTTWIRAIAEHTHGWPQHIMAFLDPALKRLHREDGHMTAEGLNAVLRKGMANREAYYMERTDSFITEQLQGLSQAVAVCPNDMEVSYTTIIEFLSKHFDIEEAKQIFDNTLKKGLIARFQKGYAVPIPSMKSWLMSEYPPFPPVTQ